MKPTALVLNILVASLTATVFFRVGLLDWRRLWPFLLGSIPLAFVGILLILAAVRLVWGAGDGAVKAGDAPGGIFLSPLLIFTRWATTRQASGMAAAFILANSISGLAGHLASVRFLPAAIVVWAVAAVSGGALGSLYGSRKLATGTLQRLLAAVLVTAGAKLIFTR